ncbi:unnamed protein product [Gongylonema pulchrum]|uniref:WD_REPEATS_REGION domain-containing protein n=1 Tax=Gongylonema pulchrum TaxID=637853 RepID=A0A183CZF2_9BILA|nr:unnamed protein product [Gongylonema pulchrum]
MGFFFRLANDLAMWKPYSPVFNNCNRRKEFEESDDGLFQLCRPPNRKGSVHSDSNVSCSRHSVLTVNALSSDKAHNFCILANVNDGRLLIGTEFGVCIDFILCNMIAKRISFIN